MSYIARTSLLAVMLLASGLSLAEDTCPSPPEDFRKPGKPDLKALECEFTRLETSYPGWAWPFKLGSSAGDLPQWGIRIASVSSVGKPERLTVITGTFHGPEYLYFEHELPRAFLERSKEFPGLTKYLAEGGAIDIIPVFNPDGYVAKTRGNKNGKDLNRDYPIKDVKSEGFTQPESIALDDHLKKAVTAGTRLDLLWNYHCCAPALIYRYAYAKEAKLPKDELIRHQAIGKLVTESLGEKYRYGAHTEIFDYLAKGTAEDYVYETYGSLALVLEGTKARLEATNFENQLTMWERIFQAFNAREY